MIINDKKIMKMGKYRIKPRNLLVWIADQFRHPATLLQRKTWGVFSKYAHVRRSDHLPKNSEATRKRALEVADFMARKYGRSYSIYKCLYCDGWHVARDPDVPTTNERQPTEVMRHQEIPNDLDFDMILKLDIPDIARVYGGVRGRTMSSVHQDFAWPIIKKAGIRTIIDLREDGRHTRLSHLCAKFGINYFFFPVDRKCDGISTMADLFPSLCETIDAGNFYISCAMGLHRTDIALCCYWVFYGAERGIPPMEIRGYRKADGHDINKIMRVLNALYKCFSERNGQPPFSQEIFKKRKQIIMEKANI